MVKPLAVVAAALVALVLVRAHQPHPSAPWRVTSSPFRIDLLHDDRVVTSLGGDAPLTYVTAAGVQHRLTRVVAERQSRAEPVLTVATDEHARTARVTVRVTRRGLQLSYALDRPDGVAALGYTLRASSSAHFLGTGERQRWVDMRSTVVPLKVYNDCASSSPTTFYASTAGFGSWIESDGVGRIAFPGAVDDSTFACDLGSPPCSVGPPVAAVRVCLKQAAVAFDVAFGSLTQLVRTHAAATAFPRPPWLPQFALIKWRDVVAGPRRPVRRRPPASLAQPPDRLDPPRQPMGTGRGARLLRVAHVRPFGVPGPEGDDRAHPPARSPLHALDLAADRAWPLPRAVASGRVPDRQRQSLRARPLEPRRACRVHARPAPTRRARRRRFQGRPRRRDQPRARPARRRKRDDDAERVHAAVRGVDPTGVRRNSRRGVRDTRPHVRLRRRAAASRRGRT